MNKITTFRREYHFLSNFYQYPFTYKGLVYPNAEAAFQAQKCSSDADRIKYTLQKNPVRAKQMGKKERIFAFGGAESHDKQYRKLGVTMWEEELQNEKEMEHGRQVLESANWNADIVITHSLPSRIQEDLFSGTNYRSNRLTDFFDELDEKMSFKLWFSGHYHHSGWYDKKHILIYNDVVKLTDTGIERVYPRGNR